MKRIPEDLANVRAELQAWRGQRKGKERIPEKYWEAAVAMLERYSFEKVRKQLNLNTDQLKKRAQAKGIVTQQQKANTANIKEHSHNNNQAFLKVSAGELMNSLPIANTAQLSNSREQSCRIVIERIDGSRLSLSLPVELNLIQSICNEFIKA